MIKKLDELLENYCVNTVSKFINKSYLKKQLQELLNLPLENECGKLLYHYINKLFEIPKCICGKEKIYKGYSKGYTLTCGTKKCVNFHKVESIKTTCQSKYGVDFTFQLDEQKQKSKETLIAKYGVDNASKSSNVIQTRKENNLIKWGYEETLSVPSIRKQITETCINKYGVDNPQKNQEIHEKTILTFIDKYGVDNPQKNQEIHEKTALTSLNKNMVETQKKLPDDYILKDSIYNEISKCYDYTISCNKGHEFTMYKYTFYNRFDRHENKITLCPVCSPVVCKRSIIEDELLVYISSLYKEEIIISNRSIIKPLELDIYLPDLKFAFEFNGIYWHSDKYLDNDYHKNKRNKAKEKGITLYHIFEDYWHKGFYNLKIKNIFTNKKILTDYTVIDFKDELLLGFDFYLSYKEEMNIIYIYDFINYTNCNGFEICLIYLQQKNKLIQYLIDLDFFPSELQNINYIIEKELEPTSRLILEKYNLYNSGKQLINFQITL